MRISNRSALILLVCVLGVSTSVAESAKSLYHKGQVAEAKQDYLEAYAAYKAAYDEKPTDLRYRSAFERLKFQAAAVHVKRGQQLRQSGDLQKALQEFQTAAQIDPSSFIAQQEIARTQAQISGAASGGNTTQQEPKREDILRQRIEQAQGPVSLAPSSMFQMTVSFNASRCFSSHDRASALRSSQSPSLRVTCWTAT